MKRLMCYTGALATCAAFLLGLPVQGSATESATGNGHITFTGDYDNVGVQDPEHPGGSTDPGTSPSTKGNLRIDFVPQFNFTGGNKISDQDMT